MDSTPRDHSLYASEDTTAEEVVEFLRYCIDNPVEYNNSLIWNFSTYKVKESGLESIAHKERSEFLIPYQVTGMWGFMFSVLPERIRQAETLVYKPDWGEYVAYVSMYRTTEPERREQFKSDLSRLMNNTLEE